jgi:cell division protein FtsL
MMPDEVLDLIEGIRPSLALLILAALMLAFSIYRVNRDIHELKEKSDLEKEKENCGW